MITIKPVVKLNVFYAAISITFDFAQKTASIQYCECDAAGLALPGAVVASVSLPAGKAITTIQAQGVVAGVDAILSTLVT